MAVGANAVVSTQSYVAIGRETTFATYNTCTSSLDVLSSSIKTMKENKILEQIERSRVYTKRISTSKKVEGDLEFYYSPTVDACNYLLQNAFGGTVTSATATGETTGAGSSSAMNHTFEFGAMDQSYTSICINHRKGDSATGKVFQYSGLRVNEISFSATLDEALKCKTALIGVDSTVTTNDVASVLSTNVGYEVLSFVNGRVSVEASFASLTSTSFWHVQSVDFGWSNNLKADSDSRRIGSDLLNVLPPGIASLNLKCKIRFDTTTAYDAMLNATKLSAQLEFLGPTLSGSNIRQGIKLNYPTLYVNNAGDPEVGGPDQILTSEVEFHVLKDDTTTTGYALQAVVTNQKASYA